MSAAFWLLLALFAAAPDEAAGPEPPAGQPAAQPVAVTTRVTPDPSNVGDVLELEVAAAYPRGVTVNLPTVLSFDPLHLVGIEESEPEATGEGLRKTFKIQLQQFAIGPAQVPAFELTYVNLSGEVLTVPVPPREFTVDAVLANEADPQRRPEDPPISIKYPNETAETIVYAALGTLLFALLFAVVLRRLRRRTHAVVLPPPIPAHEVAFDALRELEDGELVAQKRFQIFYLQLTEIAKAYLQGRFGLLALDRTTEEIRRSLIRDEQKLAPLSANDVIGFLHRCDLVKFARFEPRADEAAEALGRVRVMVERTVPAAQRKDHGDEPSPAPQEPADPAEAKEDTA